MSEEVLWPAVLEGLTEKLRKSNLPHQVANAKTFEAKINKVLDNLTIRKKIATYISKCGEVHHAKSGTTASRLRDQGNDKFKAKDNAGALKLYSESIICSPEFGPEKSLAFGNRSAALFHIGEYESALNDVNMALKSKYPKNLEYKILQRQAQCLLRLGLYEQALEALNKCETAIAAARLSDEKKGSVTRDVNAIALEITGLINRSSPAEKAERKRAPEFSNPSLPYASPKLDLKHSEDATRGRYVVATQELKEGEVIFSEEPYSSVLLPDQYSTHCHHCYRRIEAPLPCKKCTQPRYCSSECVEDSWVYHQYECGQLDLLHNIGIGHLAVRTILLTGLQKLKDVRKAVKEDNYDVKQDDPYSWVYSLVHHANKMQEDECFQYTVTAALLATFLAKRTRFLFPNKSLAQLNDTEPDEDLVSYIGGLILRHLCQLVGNAHAITEVKESDNGDVQQVRLATAIYPSASMMNHSCLTTIVNQFEGRRLVVRLTRALGRNAEVTNCYGPHHRRHSFAERQEVLLTQYKFRCLCPACSDPKERNFLRRFDARKCDLCTGPVIDEVCNDCDKQVKISSEYEMDIDRIVGKLLTLKMKSYALHTPGQVTKLEECEKELSRIQYKHNHHLASVRDKLARAYSDNQQYGKAANLTRLSVASVEERYGGNSIEAGHELLKLTDLIFAQIQNGEKIESSELEDLKGFLSKAESIFCLHYGSGCRYCTELNQKLNQLT